MRSQFRLSFSTRLALRSSPGRTAFAGPAHALRAEVELNVARAADPAHALRAEVELDAARAAVQRRSCCAADLAHALRAYLKAALNLAWRNGLVPSDDAWRRVKPFRAVEAPLVRYLSADEIARLRNATAGGFRDLVHLALLTGCRYGELTRFQVADYNADVGTLSVRIAKGGKVRHVTLTDEASDFVDRLVAGRSAEEPLLRRDDGRAWKRAEQVRPMREACARAGIVPAVGFHILRHTHGSLLAMRAVPMAVIARQLGHADTRMTEKHYAHLAPNYVADTIRESFPRLLRDNVIPINSRSMPRGKSTRLT
jgi:integrase